jgi:hypothetical protein
VQELLRRCDQLIRLIEKENEDEDAAASKKAKGAKKVGGGGDSQAPSGEGWVDGQGRFAAMCTMEWC